MLFWILSNSFSAEKQVYSSQRICNLLVIEYKDLQSETYVQVVHSVEFRW